MKIENLKPVKHIMKTNRSIFKTFFFKIKWILIFLFLYTNSFPQSTRGVMEDHSEDKTFSNTKALIIGISKYKYIDTLNFAHSDALNFYH
jgi:hypothetical protein